MSLIRTIEQLRPHLPVAYSDTYASLPAFDNATLRYLLPIIGTSVYNRLDAGLTANDLGDDETALLLRCREVIAPFAYLANLPFIQTKLTNNGLVALQADGTRKAFKWEYNEVLTALTERGYAAQEMLISHLRSNYASFPDWQMAPYNDAANFGIIRNGQDLGEVIGLQYPQRVYQIIKPLFRKIEQRYLEPALGEEFYAVLNARLIAEDQSNEDSRLLRKLRPAVASWAMALAAEQMNMRFDESGFTITDGARTKDNINEGKMSGTDQQIQRLIVSMNADAQVLFDQAVDYLNKAASDSVFPEFKVSALYKDPALNPSPRDRNVGRTGFFVHG